MPPNVQIVKKVDVEKITTRSQIPAIPPRVEEKQKRVEEKQKRIEENKEDDIDLIINQKRRIGVAQSKKALI